MSYTVKSDYRRAKKAGEPNTGSLKEFARAANPEGRTKAGDQRPSSAAKWLAGKAAHKPAKWHRAAVKAAKADGRRAFNRKSSAARRAAKAKVAK